MRPSTDAEYSEACQSGGELRLTVRTRAADGESIWADQAGVGDQPGIG
jgi:hypothetical protein